jgi:hypothetical protein
MRLDLKVSVAGAHQALNARRQLLNKTSIRRSVFREATVPPAPQRYEAPHSLDDSERPGSLQKAIAGGCKACNRKREHETGGARLEPIEDQHRRHCDRAKDCQRIHLVRVSGSVAKR